jgi:hypothetical protein
MWVMLFAFSSELFDTMKWNWDATQFICAPDGRGSLCCYVKDNVDDSPLTSDLDNGLSLCVKWMHMGSAAGEVIPLVLLIAVTEMSDNDFEFYPVVGMTHQNIIDRTGYLCFTKTRAGNGLLNLLLFVPYTNVEKIIIHKILMEQQCEHGSHAMEKH